MKCRQILLDTLFPSRRSFGRVIPILFGLGRFCSRCGDVPVLERCEQRISKLLCGGVGLVDVALHIDPIPQKRGDEGIRGLSGGFVGGQIMMAPAEYA